MDLNLLQREVAVIIGVDKGTIENWEYGATAPHLRAWPHILKFLGYDPRPPGQVVGEKLRRHRQGRGLSWSDAAKLMKVDPATISKWERQPDDRHDHRSLPTIATFLGRNPLAHPNSLGAYIRQSRQLVGLNQKALGSRLGIRQDVVSRWELGRSRPSARELDRIEAIFGSESPYPIGCPEELRAQCRPDDRYASRRRPRSEPPSELRTLGDHIRRRRLELGLSQANLAEHLGVNRNSITNWEAGVQEPDLGQMPAIIEFLGHEPSSTDADLADRIRAKRRALGLSQADLGN